MSEKDNNQSRIKTTMTTYSRIASKYASSLTDQDDPVMRAETRTLFMDRLKGKRILEVGCGPGKDSKAFFDAGLDVAATDNCADFIEIVRERYPEMESKRMDMTKVTFADNTFDGIYGFASFLHLPRPVSTPTLKEFWRVLNPGGLLYLTLISSSMHREYIISDWAGVENNPLLFTCYDEPEFCEMLQDTGFADIEILHVKCEAYENLPRLQERGIKVFHIAAQTAKEIRTTS